MYIVLLRLVDGSKASGHMDGHKAWLQKGFADEVFFYVGGIQGGGGAVLAAGITPEDLHARVDEDPFVVEGVVTPEIIELDTTMSDPRLAFLVEFTGERLGYQRDPSG
jgi:uncharacterized protein YciI